MDNNNVNLINKIRMTADLRVVDSPKNFDTRESVRLKRGDSVVFEILLLNAGEIVDVSNLGVLSFEILDVGEKNSPLPRSVKLLASKSLSASEINSVSSMEAFEEGACHASFYLGESETLFSEGHKWLSVVGYTNDGKKSTFAQGWIDVFAQYGSEDLILDTPVDEDIAIGKNYANANYLKVSENFFDIDDASAARENLNVYSKSELNARVDPLDNRIADLEFFRKDTSHAGAFFLGKDSVLRADKQTYGKRFSFAFTLAMSRTFFDKTSPSAIIVGAVDESEDNLGWALKRVDTGRAVVNYRYRDATATTQIAVMELSDSQTSVLFDGERHACVFAFSGTRVGFFVDGKLFNAITISAVNSTLNLAFQARAKGAVLSRMVAFNFNICDGSPAPYSGADYAKGKPIPLPLLRETISYDINDNWTVDVANNFEITKNSDEMLITNTVEYFNNYIWIRLKPIKIKSGSVVSFKYDRFEANTAFAFRELYLMLRSSNVTVLQDIPNGQWVTLPSDVDEIRVWFTMESVQGGWKFSVGEYLKIVGLKIEVKGATFALDDSISGAQISDKSSNKNNAVIFGDVVADKVNNPALCSDKTSFSWAGTATTQKFHNSDIVVPANSCVTAYAKASVAGRFGVKCGTNQVEYIDVAANAFAKVGEWTNVKSGAFTVSPSSSYTGIMEVFLKIEKY